VNPAVLQQSNEVFKQLCSGLKESKGFTRKYVNGTEAWKGLDLQLELEPDSTGIGMILFCDYLRHFDDIQPEQGSIL
jgi:hypothetical protein